MHRPHVAASALAILAACAFAACTKVDAAPALRLVNPAPGSRLFVGANFWNIDWEGQADYFRDGVDFRTTKDPWQPQLLTDLAPYHVLRFHDWNQTETPNNPQAVWSTRKQKTAPQNEPVAYEWQIDLCNRTKKDYWLTVPHEASPASWTALAKLVRAELNPSLRVYLEWSNEVWNTAYPQSAYAAKEGRRLGLAGRDPGASFYVYQAVRLFEAFEAVFGKGSPRLVRVLAGQAEWDGPCQNDVAALADRTINPHRTMPDVYAVAPYVTGKTVAELTNALPGLKAGLRANSACAAKIARPLISYEGGTDSFSTPRCETVQIDPAMRKLYATFLTTLVQDGLKGPFMQYTHTGSCWGLKAKTSAPVSKAPKYQGLLDWLAAQR